MRALALALQLWLLPQGGAGGGDAATTTAEQITALYLDGRRLATTGGATRHMILVPEGTKMSALTVQVLRLSLSLGSVTAVNLRRSVCGAQGSLDR